MDLNINLFQFSITVIQTEMFLFNEGWCLSMIFLYHKVHILYVILHSGLD